MFPGEGHGYPPQYSCLENPMDRNLVGYNPWGHKGFSSIQFSRSVVSDSLRPHESQHALGYLISTKLSLILFHPQV